MHTIYPTHSSADTPATTTHLTTTVPIRLQSHRPYDRAVKPAIHQLLLAPYCHTPDNDSAVMPAIYRSIDRPSSTLDPLSSPDACTVLLPQTDCYFACSCRPVAASTCSIPLTIAALPAAFH